jgi:hypothetical protein
MWCVRHRRLLLRLLFDSCGVSFCRRQWNCARDSIATAIYYDYYDNNNYYYDYHYDHYHYDHYYYNDNYYHQHHRESRRAEESDRILLGDGGSPCGYHGRQFAGLVWLRQF